MTIDQLIEIVMAEMRRAQALGSIRSCYTGEDYKKFAIKEIKASEDKIRSSLTQLLDELGEEIVQRSVSNNFFKSERFTKTDEVLSAIARIRGGKNDR